MKFEHLELRRKLTNRARAAGADTRTGHTYYNLIEMLQNLPPPGVEYLERDGVRSQRENLVAGIEMQMGRLAARKAQGE